MNFLLVDTSVWADHIRKPDERLSEQLAARRVFCHPFVRGEVALGNIPNRRAWLTLMSEIRQARKATDGEVADLIENRRLHGRGIGYVDCHLVAATLLTPGLKLWTRDRRLDSVAADLGIQAAV